MESLLNNLFEGHDNLKGLFIEKLDLLKKLLELGNGGLTIHIGIKDGRVISKIHYDMSQPVDAMMEAYASLGKDVVALLDL